MVERELIIQSKAKQPFNIAIIASHGIIRMSSSSESEREDDSSVGSRFVDEDLLSDDDVEAWMERPRQYMIVKKSFMDEGK